MKYNKYTYKGQYNIETLFQFQLKCNFSLKRNFNSRFSYQDI